jgi:DNA-directed RNA polymerase alpha subunit
MNMRMARQPHDIADAVEWYWKYGIQDHKVPERETIEEHLDESLELLNENQRYILVERADKHRSFTEIADELHISKERPRQVYARALSMVCCNIRGIIKRQEMEKLPADETPIDVLDLIPADTQLLKRRGITTVGQLSDMTGVDLMKIRSVGFTKAERIIEAYRSYETASITKR